MDMLYAYFTCDYGCNIGFLRQLGTSFLDQFRKLGVRYNSKEFDRDYYADHEIEDNDDGVAFSVRYEGKSDDFDCIRNLILEYFLFLRDNFPHIRKLEI